MSEQKIDVFQIESFADKRASRFFDLFPELSGQITVSIINAQQFSGWHKHKKQYDQFFVADGEIKIAIISPAGKVSEEILNSAEPRTILIPPDHWHCYHSISETATLIYYLSRKHDESDELRASEEDIFKSYNYKISI